MSREPSGMGARWERIRARQRDEAADAAAEALCAAFQAELAATDPNELFARAVSAAVGTQDASRVRGPGGPRSAAQKAAVMAAWQAQRDAHWARHGRGYSITRPGQVPVFASATAPDVSPLLQRLYGLG
jgi:hypothetical protein